MKELSRQFITLLRYLFDFQPVKDYSDEIWHFHAPSLKYKSKWLVQSFTKYQDTIYWTINFNQQLEFNLKKKQLQLEKSPFHSFEEYDIAGVIRSCIQTLQSAKKDWLKYHRELLRSLPKKYRFGLIQRRILWKLWPDIYRPDLKLTQKELGCLEAIFKEQEGLTEKLVLPAIPSLNTYMDYCRMAYLANDVRLKMEGRDNIGIIPEYHSLHRANQLFDSKDHVFDCIHLHDLEQYKKKAAAFITWQPLDPLYPKKPGETGRRSY